MSGKSRRGPIIVLILILIALSVSAGAMLFLTMAVGGAPAPIPTNAALHLKLAVPLPETPPNDLFSQFGEARPTLRSMTDAIRRAATDSRVKAIVFTPQTLGGLWAQAHELRSALVAFRESGKPLTAYMEYGGSQDYYLASAASRIVLMPAGQLDVTGLAMHEVFFRGTLDKLGVFPDLLHIGDYKTASNNFTERTFTPEHREATETLNRDWFTEYVRAVASGRNIPEDRAREIIGAGPYLAQEALDAGLVDALAYQDEVEKEAPFRDARRFDGDSYARQTSGAGFGGPRIALLYATGTITSGKSPIDASAVGSDTFTEWVRKSRLDPSVRAIVVRVDSPGGSAIASEVMWRELMLAREAKPVIVSMGDVAASGGYYIAVPAHAIVAQPGTLTGSIGVVTGKYVIDGTMDKLGVGIETVTAGGNAEIYSPFRPFTPPERETLERQMRKTYDLFVSRVAEGRSRTTEEINAVAQGRVWTGLKAKELGLVDELGGLDTALQLAKTRAKLDADADVHLLVYPPKRSAFEILANPLGTSSEFTMGAITRRPELQAIERAAAVLRLFRRGEPLMLMPNVFVR
jgi:protease-4